MSCHRDIEAQKCQITAKFAHWGKWHFELSEACDLIHGIEDKRNSQKITHINIWSLATLKWGKFFLQYQQHPTLWHLQVRTIILLTSTIELLRFCSLYWVSGLPSWLLCPLAGLPYWMVPEIALSSGALTRLQNLGGGSGAWCWWGLNLILSGL